MTELFFDPFSKFSSPDHARRIFGLMLKVDQIEPDLLGYIEGNCVGLLDALSKEATIQRRRDNLRVVSE